MSNQHVLKIHPAPLTDLMSGAKTAEVRRNDRDFQVGDTVRLMEVNPETLNWTGRPDLVRTISHIQTGYGLPDGMCVLSYAQAEQQGAGHGHVTPRADGVVMKCGGPGLCAVCTAEQEAQGAQAGEFQREDRYIVIKRKDLVALHRDAYGPTQVAIEAFYGAIRMIEVQLPRRDYLVIEGDWPEYEPTWAAIQARVEGRATLTTQPAAGDPVRVVVEPGEELSPSNLVGNRIDRMLTIGTRLYTAPPAAAHGDDAPGTVRVTADWLKMVHRDLDSCQKVIWLAGCRPRVPGGFDPAYCEDAQARLKEIDEHIARAQGDGGAA